MVANIRTSSTESYTIYVDESAHRDFLSCGAVALRTVDVDSIRLQINKLIENELANPYRAGTEHSYFEEIGFHFSQDHRELKNVFLDMMDNLFFEAFIAFDISSGPVDRRIRPLYYYVIKQCLARYGRIERIVVESRTGKKSEQSSLQEIVDRAIGRLAKETVSRQYEKPLLEVVNKREQRLLSIPDYVLAIFRIYLLISKQGDITARDYLRISNRLRWIFDAGKRNYYTAKNPFSLDIAVDYRK